MTESVKVFPLWFCSLHLSSPSEDVSCVIASSLQSQQVLPESICLRRRLSFSHMLNRTESFPISDWMIPNFLLANNRKNTLSKWNLIITTRVCHGPRDGDKCAFRTSRLFILNGTGAEILVLYSPGSNRSQKFYLHFTYFSLAGNRKTRLAFF